MLLQCAPDLVEHPLHCGQCSQLLIEQLSAALPSTAAALLVDSRWKWISRCCVEVMFLPEAIDDGLEFVLALIVMHSLRLERKWMLAP